MSKENIIYVIKGDHSIYKRICAVIVTDTKDNAKNIFLNDFNNVTKEEMEKFIIHEFTMEKAKNKIILWDATAFKF